MLWSIIYEKFSSRLSIKSLSIGGSLQKPQHIQSRKLKMASSIKTCGTCKLNLTAVRKPGISCSNCGVYYNYTCIDLRAKTVESIESDNLHWLCGKCIKIGKGRRSNIIPAVLPSPRESRTKVAKTKSVPIDKASINVSKVSVKSKVAPLKESEKLSILAAKLDELSSKYTAEIAEIKYILKEVCQQVDKFTSVEIEVANLKSTANLLEVKTDLNERKLIANTVEIQGLPRIVNRNINTTVNSIARQIKASFAIEDIKQSKACSNKET